MLFVSVVRDVCSFQCVLCIYGGAHSNGVCVCCVVTYGANSEMDGSWQADSVVQ